MAALTLLSDFGLHDASAAVVKGMLAPFVPPAQIADITHEIAPFQVAQAAYVLGAAYKSFPAGTIHLVLVNIFNEATPRLVLCHHNAHYFLAADNDILPLALSTDPLPAWQCTELLPPNGFSHWVATAGSIAHLLQSNAPGELGLPALTLSAVIRAPATLPTGNSIACDIVYIDHYGNAVTNLTRAQFNAAGNGRPFRLEFMQVEDIGVLSRSYSDVRPGHKLCRFNSSGFMEICVNHGKAASLFGLRPGSEYNNIKLVFE
ncbi:MAG: SAM-dependent chlorinase/fluorinase [Bacteroidota bacterium]